MESSGVHNVCNSIKLLSSCCLLLLLFLIIIIIVVIFLVNFIVSHQV
jgi:hypothetical protein